MNNIILDKYYTESLISVNKQNQKTQTGEALLSFILYDKIFLPSRFGISKFKNFKDLFSEGIIEIIPQKYKHSETVKSSTVINYFQDKVFKAFDLDLTKGTRFNTINDSVEYFGNEIIADIDEKFDSLLDAANIYANDASALKLNKEIVFEYYKKRTNKLRSNFTSDELSSYGFYFPEYFSFNEEYDFNETLKIIESNKKNFINEIEEKFSAGDFSSKKEYNSAVKSNVSFFKQTLEQLKFLIEHIEFQELIAFSSNNNTAIKGDLGILKDNPINTTIQNAPDNLFQVYKIILDEVQYMPVISSIDDVLRLREDIRIKDFRENMFEWSNVLYSGDIKQEQKLRRELKKSNKEIKTIKSYQKIGGIITYASLPLIAIDAITQIPAGILLSVLGAAVQFKGDNAHKKNKWLLFGRTL